MVGWSAGDVSAAVALVYARLARQLGVKFSSETSRVESRHVLRRVLADRDDWLLIFDNAPDYQTIQNYLPLRPSGNVIITTRNANWGERATTTQLPPFSRTEAVNFLRKRTNRNDSSDSAKKLCQA